MGLFRNSKTAIADTPTPQTINTAPGNVPRHPSLRSPTVGSRSASSPGLPSPIMPYSPIAIPKIDLPRPPDPELDPAGYLRSLGAVRDRSKIVGVKALRNELRHFDVDMQKFPDVVRFVAGIVKRDYDAPFTGIPSHGRYQHFCAGGRDRIAQLLNLMTDAVDVSEKCRRIVDLFFISVILDAGAGTQWSYTSRENNRIYRRSEGIAIATYEMFKKGLFSSNRENPYQADKLGLRALTVDCLAEEFQSRPGNEMVGIEGRTQLLVRLASALDEKTEFFGVDGRPGNLIDHLLSHPSTQASSILIVPLPVLWNILMNGLVSIWPASRTAINGISLGDAWPCLSMPQPTEKFGASKHATAAWETIVPFHKLTQWLCYSLMQPMQSILKMHFAGVELLTGLPEYRNGGLFIDMGVLTLKQDDLDRGLQNYSDYCRRTGVKAVEVAPMFEVSDDVIVEWRGVTIGFLDLLCVEVNKALKNELGGNTLSLAQLLEAGTWKGGREIAEVSRPNTKQSPILIDSDGTVF